MSNRDQNDVEKQAVAATSGLAFSAAKPRRRGLAGIFALLAAIACQTLGTQAQAQQASFGSLEREVAKRVTAAVYEVVVPKVEDTTTKYDRELPFERLPFAMRHDKYLGIGTAFRIGPRRFVSAAKVFNAQLLTLWTDFSLRAANGDVVKVGKFTRYSMSRDLVEFEVAGELRETAVLATTARTTPGEQVFAVGNALGEGISFRGGQVASYTPEEVEGAFAFIRFSAPASFGNNGGPLINISGQVVGVVVQKSKSENLNFAVPIRELDHLSTAESEFLLLNAPISLGFDTTYKSWRYASKLPSTFPDLAQAAQASLQESTLKGAQDMLLSSRPKFFPEDEAFRIYLRHQGSLLRAYLFSEPLGVLKKTSEGAWQVRTTSGLRNNLVEIYGRDMAFFPKPPDISARAFAAKPQFALDALLAAHPRYRHFNGVDVRITSVGEPASVAIWEDMLGRPWIEARWPMVYGNELWATQCHLTPGGAVCLVSLSYAGAVPYVLDLNRYTAPLLQIPYIGSIDEWREFLALDKKYLSNIVRTGRISIDKKRVLTFAFDQYALSYPSAMPPNVDSLAVVLGYSPRARLALEVQEIGVSNGAYHDSVAPMFSPQVASPESHKKEWRDAIAGLVPYNGSVVKASYGPEIYKVLPDRWPNASTPAPDLERRYIVHCVGKPPQDPQRFNDACAHFASGIKISPGQ